jgi:hypothetical protein
MKQEEDILCLCLDIKSLSSPKVKDLDKDTSSAFWVRVGGGKGVREGEVLIQ